jgi:DnaJ-class molecular chaperone
VKIPSAFVTGGDGADAPTVVRQCDRCQGRGEVGPREFPVTCPPCHGTGAVIADG